MLNPLVIFFLSNIIYFIIFNEWANYLKTQMFQKKSENFKHFWSEMIMYILLLRINESFLKKSNLF